MTADDVELVLTPRHIDRLLEALADAPLIQRHVRRQWWESGTKDRAVGRDQTPSLTSASPTASWSSAATGSAFTSGPLPQARKLSIDPTRPSTPPSPLPYSDHGSDTLASPTKSALAYVPPASLLAPPLCSFETPCCNGVTIVDSSVHGSPVRFVSRDFHLGNLPLRIGSCSFFSMSYGASVECQLRKDIRRPRSHILLQIANRLVERKTGRKGQLLVAELDVTEAFVKAVLAEFAAHTSLPRRCVRERLDSGVQSSSTIRSKRSALRRTASNSSESLVDWTELAESMETDCLVTRAVEQAATSFASLDTSACTMQTLTLMADLERLRNQHQNFCVVRASDFHPARRGRPRVPQSLHVPWISQHWQRDRTSPLLPTPRSRALRERIVDAVAQHVHATALFSTRVCGYPSESYVAITCVPLVEGRRDDADSDCDVDSDDESFITDYSDEDDLPSATKHNDRGDDTRRIGAWVCFLNAEGAY